MKTRVLIIDDDCDHAESIADILVSQGHDTELAFTGQDGVAKFRKSDFDIVLLDFKLPDTNGLEVFIELRKIRPRAKAILMTGFSLEQVIEQAIDKGVLGVLHKPFELKQFMELIEQVKPHSTVLIVDDDTDFAASLEAILEQNGYRVRIAGTGHEALDRLIANDIDCLILDLKMPVLSGIEVYLKLKEAGRMVPTIFVTGHQLEKELLLGQRDPPIERDIFTKPLNLSDLLAVIKTATNSNNVPKFAT